MADKRIVTVDYLNSEGLNKGYINNTFANALKGSKSDTAMLLDDVSPVTHEMGVKVRNKNLIPYPYKNSTQTISGITFTVNSDGTITANGTATSNAYFEITSISTFYLPKGNYILSGCPSGGSSKTYNLTAVNGIGSSYTKFRQDIGNGISLSSSGEYWTIRCQVMAGQTVKNIVFKPQLELGTTATDYTPYVPDLTAVKVKRCGKNLLSSMSLFPTITNNAVPIHFKAGQKYTISFTTTYTAWRLMFFGTDKNGTAFDASNTNTSKYISDTYTGATGRLQLSGNRTGNTFTFTCNEDCIITAIVFWNVSNETNKTYSDFQLELGTTATEYEPYKECAEYTPTADGTVNGVTSLYPNTTLMTDTEGVIIDCEYNRDINKAFIELQQAIISLGGNV